jgi:UDP-glucose 4-epimerase
VDEDVLLGPSSVYGATKVTCEQLSISYREQLDVDAIGIRIGACFGTGRLSPQGTGAFNRAVRDVALGSPAVFPATLGPLEREWQPMYDEDAASAFVAGTLVGPTEHGILNAPLGGSVTVAETMEALLEMVPSADLVFDSAAPPERGADFPLLDGTRARQELGVIPRYDLRAAVAEMIERFRSGADAAPASQRRGPRVVDDGPVADH